VNRSSSCASRMSPDQVRAGSALQRLGHAIPFGAGACVAGSRSLAPPSLHRSAPVPALFAGFIATTAGLTSRVRASPLRSHLPARPATYPRPSDTRPPVPACSFVRDGSSTTADDGASHDGADMLPSAELTARPPRD